MSKKITEKKEKKELLMDAIVPISHMNEHFEDNLYSWMHELPIRKLFIGRDGILYELERMVKQYPNVEVIDMKQYSTLGKVLVELMKKVETEWFAYVHADVQLTPYSLQMMLPYMNDVSEDNEKSKVGIIESDHLHYDGIIHSYHEFFFRERSYSGFQLIRKECIENVINKIEDDYVYRNEDYIFQNACTNNGFRYVKSMAPHIHQTKENSWAYDEKIVFIQQVKGIIKYTTPTVLTIEACIGALKKCIRKRWIRLFDFLNDFVRKKGINKKWEQVIIDRLK